MSKNWKKKHQIAKRKTTAGKILKQYTLWKKKLYKTDELENETALVMSILRDTKKKDAETQDNF